MGLAVVIATAAIAVGPPPGFTEARALEPAASFVAGKPAAVYCAPSLDAWRSYTGETSLRQRVGGLTRPGSSMTLLSPEVCSPLLDRLARRWTDSYDVAAAIATLVHESIHQRGSADEGETECAAMHEMPRVAVKYFRVKAGKQLRALMSDAWAFHDEMPAAYTTVC